MADETELSNTISTVAFISMIVLALVGVGLTSSQSSIAFRYWVVIVPLFGLISIAAAWFQEYDGSRWTMLKQQAMHWAAITVAVGLDFYVRGIGAETASATGLSSLLLLALGSFLVGIYFDRRFIALGLLLALAVVIMSKINQYNWLIFAAGALLVAALAGYHYYTRGSRDAAAAANDM